MLRYLLCAAGDITTSDVDLAAASGGMVVGFNLSPDEGVLSHAKRLGEGLLAAGVGCWLLSAAFLLHMLPAHACSLPRRITHDPRDAALR